MRADAPSILLVLASCAPAAGPAAPSGTLVPAPDTRCVRARAALEQAKAAIATDGAVTVRKAAEASQLATEEKLQTGTHCDFTTIDANVLQLQGFAALGHEQMMAQYLPFRAADCSVAYAATCERVAGDLATKYRYSITGAPGDEMGYAALWTDRPHAHHVGEQRASAEWLQFLARAKDRAGAVGFVSFTVTGFVVRGSDVVVTGHSAATTLSTDACAQTSPRATPETTWLAHLCRRKPGTLAGAEVSAVVSAEDWQRIGQPYQSEPGIASSDDGKITLSLRVELTQLRALGNGKFSFGKATAPRELPADLQPFTPLARRWPKATTAARDSARRRD